MRSLKSQQEHWQEGGTFLGTQMEQAGQAARGRGAELSEPPQQPQPPARGSPEAEVERLPRLPACSTCPAPEIGDGRREKQRPGPARASHTTLDPGTQHSPGLGGQGAHRVTPQKAPTLPQQSSWVVSSSRGLAHWKRGHGMGHLFPPLLCTGVSQGSLRQVLPPPTPCQRILPPQRGEERVS